MNKVLVDTSVWIDALIGKKNQHVKVLAALIEADVSVVTCPVIIQETLQGIKEDSDYRKVKESFAGFEVLTIDPVEAALGAASLYRNIRKHGITIRKSNDCLIAFYAIFHKAILLHHDQDFEKISKFTSLKFLGISQIQFLPDFR